MSNKFTKLWTAANGWYLVVAGIVLVISIFALALCNKSAELIIGDVAAVAVDVYILWMLMVVGYHKSDASKYPDPSDSTKQKQHKLPIPHTPVALLILLIMFAAMVTSFASLYEATSTVVFAAPVPWSGITPNGTIINGATDMLYFSATSILWLTPYNLSLLSDGHWIYLWELGSAILYIFLAFPVMTTLMSSD